MAKNEMLRALKKRLKKIEIGAIPRYYLNDSYPKVEKTKKTIFSLFGESNMFHPPLKNHFYLHGDNQGSIVLCLNLCLSSQL